MDKTHSQQTPLARLVLFMICLAVAGCLLAGVQYAVVEIPHQQALEQYAQCTGGCISTNVVVSTPHGTRNPGDESCRKECYERYLRS